MQDVRLGRRDNFSKQLHSDNEKVKKMGVIPHIKGGDSGTTVKT